MPVSSVYCHVALMITTVFMWIQTDSVKSTFQLISPIYRHFVVDDVIVFLLFGSEFVKGTFDGDC